MAPYNPAVGPNPDETPKAKANGKATIPAVIPPKASPLKFEKKVLFWQRWLKKEKLKL